jgi:hypothetical protein
MSISEFMAIRSTRLKCSKHDVWLVLNSHIVHKASGPVKIEFWECPLLCGYVRARKDQVKLVKRRGPRTHAKIVCNTPKKVVFKPADDQQASFGF